LTTLLPFASALGEGGSEASESLKERQPPGLRPERGGDREPKKGSAFELMPCDMEGRPETAGDWEPRNDSAFGFRPGDAKRRARRTANSSCAAAASGGSCDGEADLERREGEPGSIYGERRLVETVRR